MVRKFVGFLEESQVVHRAERPSVDAHRGIFRLAEPA
jgi:hypothetical protein